MLAGKLRRTSLIQVMVHPRRKAHGKRHMNPDAQKLWARARAFRVEAETLTGQARADLMQKAFELEAEAEKIEQAGGSAPV